MITIKLAIPPKTILKVNAKQLVKFGQPIFEKKVSIEKSLNIAKILKIPPQKIFQVMKKNLGDFIKKGEIIAEKRGFFSKRITAKEEGIIKEINHQTGEIILEVFSQKNEKIPSFFSGTIIEIDKDFFTLQIKSQMMFSAEKISKDAGGEMFFLDEKENFFDLTEEKVTKKIVFCQKISPHVVAKCEALGAAGFVFSLEKIKTEIPFAVVKNISFWEKIKKIKEEKLLVLFSKLEKKIVLYN